MREQNIFLPFDELSFVTSNPGIVRFADLIEGVSKMTKDMELVE